jgi:hypothetical protein
MGTRGLISALPQGGQMIEEYPANIANYMDGLLKKHWTTNRLNTSETTLSTPDEVSIFVIMPFLYFFHILSSSLADIS